MKRIGYYAVALWVLLFAVAIFTRARPAIIALEVLGLALVISAFIHAVSKLPSTFSAKENPAQEKE